MTIKSLAETLRPGKPLIDWFMWPPDLFALIAIVFQRTGCYKICIQDQESVPFWLNLNYEKDIIEKADLWLKFLNLLYIDDKITNHELAFNKLQTSDFKTLFEYFKRIEKIGNFNSDSDSDIELIKLRTITTNISDDPENEKCFGYAKFLVEMYACVDYCCRSIGLLGQYESDRRDQKIFIYLANILLNTTGSLSRINKMHGIVLPKMRTPQNGINIRNMSFHLTFHQTEVEVMWRSIPWLNNHQKRINILAVPFPYTVSNSDINIIEDKYQKAKYFELESKELDDITLKDIVDEIWLKIEQQRPYDIVVFPECALNEDKYYKLLDAIENNEHKKTEHLKPLQLPLVISGVLKGTKMENARYSNEVRMATYFLGYWYDISQAKHHRWYLNNSQILQYGFENVMTPNYIHFENTMVNQRRLHILAPNSWLALTTLICEDLARQEPVTEIIRGIGPTLLFALLSDGPQIAQRWSARYASTLADDPGTSVFTLTSKGMAELSKKVESTSPEKSDVVGLWKDSITGVKEIKIKKDAIMFSFTISSKFVEEFTLDGRSDNVSASVFQFDSLEPTYPVSKSYIPLNTEASKLLLNPLKNNSEEPNQKHKSENKSNEGLKPEDIKKGNDIQHLSMIYYFVDAFWDVLFFKYRKKSPLGKDTYFSSISVLDITYKIFCGKEIQNPQNLYLKDLLGEIKKALANPEDVGILKLKTHDQLFEDLSKFFAVYLDFRLKLENRLEGTLSNYLHMIIDECRDVIKDNETIEDYKNWRNKTSFFIVLLHTIRAKFTNNKYLNKNLKEDGIQIEDAVSIVADIEKILCSVDQKEKVKIVNEKLNS